MLGTTSKVPRTSLVVLLVVVLSDVLLSELLGLRIIMHGQLQVLHRWRNETYLVLSLLPVDEVQTMGLEKLVSFGTCDISLSFSSRIRFQTEK